MFSMFDTEQFEPYMQLKKYQKLMNDLNFN